MIYRLPIRGEFPIKVYCYLPEEFELASPEFVTSATASQFEIVPDSLRRLTDEELAADQDAESGYTFTVRHAAGYAHGEF